MRSDHTEESRFERFLHWAEGEEADQGSEEAEDPERAEFVEYLEYIDSHEPMDFGAYRLMRMRERAAKGIPQPAVPGHHAVVEQRAVRAGGRKRGYRARHTEKVGACLPYSVRMCDHGADAYPVAGSSFHAAVWGPGSPGDQLRYLSDIWKKAWKKQARSMP